jgi:hypothetical protein
LANRLSCAARQPANPDQGTLALALIFGPSLKAAVAAIDEPVQRGKRRKKFLGFTGILVSQVAICEMHNIM